MCYRRETYERFLSGRACWIVALSSFLVVPTGTWARAQVSTTTRTLPPAAATQTTTTIGHQADTRTGQTVSGLSGGDDAAIIGGIAGGTALLIWAIHHHEHSLPSPESLFQKGPQVPQNVAMSHLIVDGLIGPGWPVGVDFTLEGQGSLMLDITTADKGQYHQILTNDLNGRGIVITRPPGLPDKVQAATFDLEAIPAAGSNLPPPGEYWNPHKPQGRQGPSKEPRRPFGTPATRTIDSSARLPSLKVHLARVTTSGDQATTQSPLSPRHARICRRCWPGVPFVSFPWREPCACSSGVAGLRGVSVSCFITIWLSLSPVYIKSARTLLKSEWE